MAVVGKYLAGNVIVSADGTQSFVPGGHGYDEFVAAAEANGDTIDAYAPPTPTGDQVDAERMRRLLLPVAVTLSGNRSFSLDVDGEALTNIQGRVSGAILKKMLSDTTASDFRDHDNQTQSLTADDWLSIGTQIDAARTAIYQASWALKAADPIPADYADDSHWP